MATDLKITEQTDTTGYHKSDLLAKVESPLATPTNHKTTLAEITNGGAFATIASAATLDLNAQDEFNLRVTGTTTITGLGNTASGLKYNIIAVGAFTLTNNTNIRVQGGADYTATAGDKITAISDGVNWDIFVQKNDGEAVATDLKNKCVGWVVFDGTGTLTILDSSGIVSSVTDNGIGAYRVNFSVPMKNNTFLALITAAPVTTWVGRGGWASVRNINYVDIVTAENNAAADSKLVQVGIFGELA